MVEGKTTPLSGRPPLGHEEQPEFLPKAPIYTSHVSTPIPGNVTPEIPHCREARTAVKLGLKCSLECFHGGVEFREPPSLALTCQMRPRSPGDKSTEQGLFPLTGDETLPGPGPTNKIDAHKESEISGPRDPPCVALPLRKKLDSCRKGAPASPGKRKIFIEEAIWPSKCLKAGWWMRRSATTGPIIGQAASGRGWRANGRLCLEMPLRRS